MTSAHTALPAPFVERIGRQMPDAASFIEAIGRPPHQSVRVNPAKSSRPPADCTDAVPWCGGAWYVGSRPVYTLDPLFHAGHYYPQEASSMFIAHIISLVADRLPHRPAVLDLCAAPGGKSTLLTSALGGEATVVSNEIVRSRAWILRENIVKWGYACNAVTCAEPSAFGQMGPLFDVMLVDAPCSGEGMFRKDPAATAEWSVDNAAQCAQRQRRILADAWDALAEGGLLVYSTCTFNPDENERNMEWLAARAGVEFVDLQPDPSWGITPMPFDGGCGYAFHPHRARGEGFFVCAAFKTDGRPRIEPAPGKKSRKAPRLAWPARLVDDPDCFELCTDADSLCAMPAASARLMTHIAGKVPTLHRGLPLGRQMRKEFVPDAALALSTRFDPTAYPTAWLGRREALGYLHGEWTAAVPTAQGWNAVGYEGALLGWVKVAGSRVNNYYPKEWRIRMQLPPDN